MQPDRAAENPFVRWTPPVFDLVGEQADALRRRAEEGLRLRDAAGGGFRLLEQRQRWDLAIVLDACRYDAFARVNGLPGRLEKRYSPASGTEEWLEVCLDGRFDDVVCVSASPYVSRVYLGQIGLGMPFLHLEEVWRDGWDDALGTVPPQAVIAAWRRLRAARPGRKFLLHFMQPHPPFIGATRLPEEARRKYFGALVTDPPQPEGASVYELLEAGRVDPALALAAYEDNLRLVLGCIAQALPDAPPRTVVTSDHGECFGECGIFGHPCGLPLPELIEVPWFEPSAG